MKLEKIFLALFLTTLLLLSGCSVDDISDIKSEEFVGKTVTVKGIVQDSIKLGKLSGYTLKDDFNNTISISSKNLPEDGSTKTVKGVLMKELIIGYYILESN